MSRFIILITICSFFNLLNISNSAAAIKEERNVELSCRQEWQLSNTECDQNCTWTDGCTSTDCCTTDAAKKGCYLLNSQVLGSHFLSCAQEVCKFDQSDWEKLNNGSWVQYECQSRCRDYYGTCRVFPITTTQLPVVPTVVTTEKFWNEWRVPVLIFGVVAAVVLIVVVIIIGVAIKRDECAVYRRLRQPRAQRPSTDLNDIPNGSNTVDVNGTISNVNGALINGNGPTGTHGRTEDIELNNPNSGAGNGAIGVSPSESGQPLLSPGSLGFSAHNNVPPDEDEHTL